jgi:IS605 OrfB family transposase
MNSPLKPILFFKGIDKLSMERDLFFSDYFYKISHWICDTTKERGINTIVVGLNKDWKQNSHMWDKDNQNFVGIPFAKFISILKIMGKNLYVHHVHDVLKTYKLCKYLQHVHDVFTMY